MVTICMRLNGGRHRVAASRCSFHRVGRPILDIGDQAKIIHGALAGLIGRVVALTNCNRCLLAIDSLPGITVVVSRGSLGTPCEESAVQSSPAGC